MFVFIALSTSAQAQATAAGAPGKTWKGCSVRPKTAGKQIMHMSHSLTSLTLLESRAGQGHPIADQTISTKSSSIQQSWSLFFITHLEVSEEQNSLLRRVIFQGAFRFRGSSQWPKPPSRALEELTCFPQIHDSPSVYWENVCTSI